MKKNFNAIKYLLGEVKTAPNSNRTVEQVMLKVGEEFGELSTEINVLNGFLSSKKGGSDGAVGEAIDIIIGLIDVINLVSPETTIDDINKIVVKKTNKWLKNSQKREDKK